MVVILIIIIGIITYLVTENIKQEKNDEKIIALAYMSDLDLELFKELLANNDNPNIPSVITTNTTFFTSDSSPACVSLTIDQTDYSYDGVIVVDKYGFIIEDSAITSTAISKTNTKIECSN